jgi:type VI secretion system protein ImpF
MAKPLSIQPLVPSLLDRLIDDDPTVKREPPKSQTQVLSELRASVRRDVENLLNSRCRFETWPPEHSELERSIVAYGLPDLTAANLNASDPRSAFLKLVETVVRHFEPRFQKVKVEAVTGGSSIDRVLRFRIDAVLRAYPAPEPIVFDSAVEPSTGRFELRRGRE